MFHHLRGILGVAHSPALFPPCDTGVNASQPWADCHLRVQPLYGPLPTTSVNFSTTDLQLQALFDHAEICESENTAQLAPGFEVLVEGGHYHNVWLETQPMGGAMYGVRNLRLALNNQLVFMRTQREDGRLPGMVSIAQGQPKNGSTGIINPTYSYPGNANHSMLQGFYMASPAVDVAWLMNFTAASGAPLAFLSELQSVLTRFEAWLWTARNSTHGALWLDGVADTGEDGSDKYKSIPENPIQGPFENMDMMGYAYDAQRALARIALIRGDPVAQSEWTSRMASTAAALKRRLWLDDHGACFDRERDGAQQYVSTLLHNNLRAMWHGIFSQEMADIFIARHVMNMSEFWTPTPLPSIAASDARFQNKKGNNWSGPPEGLTFQRAIRGLENYGHHAEVLLVGSRLKNALLKTRTFPQQIDPFTSDPDLGDCYGPMILAMLEYSALTNGIAVRPESSTLFWSSVATDATRTAFAFTQRLGALVYHLKGLANGTFVGWRNDVKLFECTGNSRVVTDTEGVVIGLLGASSALETVVLRLPGAPQPLELAVAPNEEWRIQSGVEPRLARKVPFILAFGDISVSV